MTTVKATKIEIEKGFIYFVDDNGNICRTKQVNVPGKKMKCHVVLRSKIKKDPGYTYFVDGHGDVCKIRLEKVEVKERKLTPSTKKKKRNT